MKDYLTLNGDADSDIPQTLDKYQKDGWSVVCVTASPGYRDVISWGVLGSGPTYGNRAPKFHLLLEREQAHPHRDRVPKFVECDTRRAKPGSPVLCGGCLSNRQTILALTDAMNYAMKQVWPRI